MWDLKAVYRIKPAPEEMPSIDWGHVHPDYKWLAADSGHTAGLYVEEPYLSTFGGTTVWDCCCGDIAIANAFTSYKRGNVAWDKSLVKRPEGV